MLQSPCYVLNFALAVVIQLINCNFKKVSGNSNSFVMTFLWTRKQDVRFKIEFQTKVEVKFTILGGWFGLLKVVDLFFFNLPL